MKGQTLKLVVTRHAVERLVERGCWRYEGYLELLEMINEMLSSGRARTDGRTVVVSVGGCHYIFSLRGNVLTLKTVTSAVPMGVNALEEFYASLSKAKVYTSPSLNSALGEHRRVITYTFKGGGRT